MWYLFGIVGSEHVGDYVFSVEPYESTILSVKMVCFKNIAIIAKEIDIWNIDELNKVEMLNKLLIHQKTLEEIMQQQLVVPIKFATLVDSLKDIQIILEENFDLFQKILKEMEGKIEFSLAVSLDVQAQLKKIAEEDANICKMKGQTQTNVDSKLIVEIGRILKDRLEELKTKIGIEIFNKLGQLAKVIVDHGRFEDNIILNTSFLISREEEEIFMQRIYELDEKFKGEFYFKCLCPLPPYNFRTVNIQKIAPKKLKEALALFEVREDMSLEDLKSKNRELVQHYHPDARQTDSRNSEQDFSQILQALDLLKSFCGTEEKPFFNLDAEHCFLTTIVEGGLS